ncbi:hypothetical protein Dimus_030878 [Dionaea muscipula]
MKQQKDQIKRPSMDKSQQRTTDRLMGKSSTRRASVKSQDPKSSSSLKYRKTKNLQTCCQELNPIEINQPTETHEAKKQPEIQRNNQKNQSHTFKPLTQANHSVTPEENMVH